MHTRSAPVPGQLVGAAFCVTGRNSVPIYTPAAGRTRDPAPVAPMIDRGRLGLLPETIVTRVILYIATSLDGYIARNDGGIDWLSTVEREGEDYGYAAF